MRALSSALRKQLETSVLAARRASESACRASIDGLGVFVDRRPEHLDADQSLLRNGLRAKWRQLGGDRELLIAESAYEQWHRLLFARFLAENNLLLHPKYKAPVTLVDCADLADELGEPDAWSVAARFAAEILPGIFRLDDPCVQLRLAPEGRYALEQILDALPADTFAADDALGWVYQFWQKDKKDEVNASERKIGGADLGPVTQLFTENYMVRFLLENSLGAWWAARHPDSPLVTGFDYLRFDDAGRPAAGSFDGWPDRVAEVTVMDPCCGSGHFLVEAFSMLWQMRAEEEGLAPVAAQDAVLRDNLFGLELDPRCVQIAMFAVALQAWKAGGGWRQLPVPNIACTGIPVKAPVEEWKELARGDQRLENALARLHDLFRDADTLGSLIDPRHRIHDDELLTSRYEEAAPLLEALLTREPDPAIHVIARSAVGVARAWSLLERSYTLVATNVPYLGQLRQTPSLRGFVAERFRGRKLDLAIAFAQRAVELSGPAGAAALVLPAEWMFLGPFVDARIDLLQTTTFRAMALLGFGAFSTPIRANPCLTILLSRPPTAADDIACIDLSGERGSDHKAASLSRCESRTVNQLAQLSNVDSRILLSHQELDLPPLSDFADGRSGLHAGDFERFNRLFWEVAELGEDWEYLFVSIPTTTEYVGRSYIVLWEQERGSMAALAESVRHLNHAAQNWRAGKPLWGHHGVVAGLMGDVPSTLYRGERFNNNCSAIVPKDRADLPALWAFCRSGEFADAVRSIDRSLKLAPRTLLKVPFDVDRWRRVADEAGPLPEPWSDDPTQWLFEGRPELSTAPLQVAVARLVGFRWPEQAESDALDTLADEDGIVCLPSVAGEAPAADRLRQLLAVAFGERWSPAIVKELLEQTGSKKKNLADWLRDEFFKQHCAMFANRPFVWNVWDGQLDGFSALLNYHRLDRKTLEKLTYTYLGQDWVERQRAEVRDGVAGAETRLSAALGLQRKLETILESEAPYDIYVRWKDTREQPIGWDPDVNDGVRLNVRPFVEAGVLRAPFNVHWRKDRGKNPDGSERDNDKHLTLANKLDARKHQGPA